MGGEGLGPRKPQYVTQVDQSGGAVTPGDATEAKQDETLARIGEVQASPTANTILARLKQIHEALDDVEPFIQNLTVEAETINLNTDTLEAKVDAANNAFATLSKAIPDATTKELRFDDIAGGDLYIGRAPDGTGTATASWEVVRYYRTATGLLTRQRYRTGVAWDSRTAGW